jgi:TolB-like protein
MGSRVFLADAAAATPPTEDEVLRTLGRILASPSFPASERRRAFLRFIVDETLAGRADRLKGFAIAVEVYDRDETFDSQSDPVVRLEARRLRRDLDVYYAEAGRSEPIRISIPKGGYQPHFDRTDALEVAVAAAPREVPRPAGEPATPPAAGGPRSIRRINLAALAFSLVAATAIGFVIAFGLGVGKQASPSVTEASVTVLPFTTIGSNEEGGYLAAGLSQQLVVDLMRFPGFRLYATPPNGTAEVSRVTPPDQRGADYVVSGSVHIEREDVSVVVQLLASNSGEVRWSGSYSRSFTPTALIAVEQDLASEIASALGQPYGAVPEDLRQRANAPELSDMQSYLCVLRAYDYRRTFQRTKFGPVRACLEDAVRREPGYADAWAMLGWLRLDGARFEFDTGNIDDLYTAALVAGEQALKLAPNSVLALKALSSINYYMGRFGTAESLARRAAELNPNDPDTLAQLGWRLAARGNFAEGIPLLEKAIARNGSPPPWYFHLVAVDALLRGDYQSMLATAERSTVDGFGVGYALVAIAQAKLGNPGAAAEALDKMAQFPPMARDPAAYFRRNGVTEATIAVLMAGLNEADRSATGL